MVPLRLSEVRATLNVIPLGRPRIDIINEHAGGEFSPDAGCFTTILPPKFSPPARSVIFGRSRERPLFLGKERNPIRSYPTV